MLGEMYRFVRHYPIPLFSLLGLIGGGMCYLLLDQKQISEWIWLLTLMTGGVPIVIQTLRGMLRGEFASDIIAMLAILTAIFSGQVFAGVVVVLMQSGGEAIEDYGMRRATSSLSLLLQRAPKKARRIKENQLEEIPVEKVQINDLLVVRVGDLIPVDGTIHEGIAEIDESALTGEPIPKTKTKEEKVLSGSIVLNGIITIRADKGSQESQYVKIVKMVQKAQSEKAPIQRLADRYAIFFTPLALFMALFGYALTQEMTTFLAVLVVATPCPLILATPLAVMGGINKAADSNIIVKGGVSLEQVANSDIIFFDKTGTITYGTPEVEKIVSFGEIPEIEILKLAAILEQFSSHSIATAILKKAKEENLSLGFAQKFQEDPGQGLSGQIEEKQILVGSKLFVEKQVGPLKIDVQENSPLIFVCIDQKCIGYIVVRDQIRREAPELMKKLQILGVKELILLTGDNHQNAKTIGSEVGIRHVEAEIFPDQKAKIVTQYLQKFSHVTMVGDGINDAPALATATVGIAMGAHGTAISAESADIVLLVDDLTKVAEVIFIGKQMLKIAKQSILIGIGLSFVLMCIALFGVITPPVGAMLQEVIDVSVILNALRARR